MEKKPNQACKFKISFFFIALIPILIGLKSVVAFQMTGAERWDALSKQTPTPQDPEAEIFNAIQFHYPYKQIIDLVRNCDNLNLKNSRGVTPLYEVIDQNVERRDQILKVMIRRGARVNKVFDQWGITPLHLTIHRKMPTTFSILMRHHASVTFKNINGDNPLHYAIKQAEFYETDDQDSRFNLIDMVAMLIEVMPDLAITNTRGFTAKQLAQQCSKEVSLCREILAIFP